MKSVLNLICYIHKFSANFYQLLAICFELFLFRTVFNLENLLPRAAHLSASFSHCVQAHTSETFSHLETMQKCGKTTRRCGLILPFRTSFARPSGHSPDSQGCLPPPTTVRQSIVRELYLTAPAKSEPSAAVPFRRCQAEHNVFTSSVGCCRSAIAGCSWAQPLHHRRYFFPVASWAQSPPSESTWSCTAFALSHRTEPQPEAAAADNTIAEQALCRCSSFPGEQRCSILLPWCCLQPVILTVSSLLVPNQSSAVPPSTIQPWRRYCPAKKRFQVLYLSIV
jgi:hypothetical protein